MIFKKLVVILNIILIVYSGYTSYINYKQKAYIMELEETILALEANFAILNTLFNLMDCSKPSGK